MTADLSRRSMFAGAAVAVATPAASPEPSRVQHLMDEYLRAADLRDESADASWLAHQAYRKKYPHGFGMVPCFLNGSGYALNDRADVLAAIGAEYAKTREFFSHSERFSCPVADIVAEIDRLAVRNLEIAEAAVAERQRRREEFDLPRLEQAEHEAKVAADQALQALCEHRCATLQEAQARAAFLDFEFGRELPPDMVEAVTKSFLA